MFRANLGDAQDELAVVEQQPCADFKRGKNFRMRQMDTVRVARCLVGVEPEIMARVQFDLIIGKGSDP